MNQPNQTIQPNINQPVSTPNGQQNQGILGNFLKMIGVTQDQSLNFTSLNQEEFEDDYKFLESYNGKNIIVTGANGDIGGTLWKLLMFYPTIKIKSLILLKGNNPMSS